MKNFLNKISKNIKLWIAWFIEIALPKIIIFSNKVFREIKPTIELFAAIIISAIVIPFGIIWGFIKPFIIIIKNRKDTVDAITSFYQYWINTVLQTLYVIAYLFEKLTEVFRLILIEFKVWKGIKLLQHSIALAIDLYGNVAAGELIEDIVTSEDLTFYGYGKFTISAATGYLEVNGFLNKRGIWFTNVLSFWFEENHSINAYNKEMYA